MSVISVIVPVYNTAATLPRCVESILTQSFTDFELILVDDGSTDGSGALCDEYAARHSRVRSLHREHGGVSAARNAGLERAFESGSGWVSFVDSDDWAHERYLERLYNAVKESGTRIALGRARETEWESAEWPRTEGTVHVWDTETLYCESGWNTVAPWGKLFDKELFRDVRFPPGRLHEDAFVLHRLLFACEKISTVDAVLYTYYLSPNSLTRSRWIPARLDELAAREEQTAFFCRYGYTAALHRSFADYAGVIQRQLSALKQRGGWTRLRYGGYIRRCARRYVRKYRPCLRLPEDNLLLQQTFPGLMWCYWTGKGIIGKRGRG